MQIQITIGMTVSGRGEVFLSQFKWLNYFRCSDVTLCLSFQWNSRKLSNEAVTTRRLQVPLLGCTGWRSAQSSVKQLTLAKRGELVFKTFTHSCLRDVTINKLWLFTLSPKCLLFPHYRQLFGCDAIIQSELITLYLSPRQLEIYPSSCHLFFWTMALGWHDMDGVREQSFPKGLLQLTKEGTITIYSLF